MAKYGTPAHKKVTRAIGLSEARRAGGKVPRKQAGARKRAGGRARKSG